MKKRIAIAYVICIHILLAIVLVKSDFIERAQRRLAIQSTGLPTEITPYFQQILRSHKRIDGNVPDGAVIFIGDSITQGLCVSAVACPSVNYGIGSDTTFGVLQRLPYYRSITRASAVVIAIGINDMKRRSNDDILVNYRTILEGIPETTPVILSAVLPVDEEIRSDLRGFSERIKNLNSGIEHLARGSQKLFFVDASPLLIDNFGNLADMYHDDGVHLNSKGYAIWIDVLRKEFQKLNN